MKITTLISLVLCISIVLSLAGCSANETSDPAGDPSTPAGDTAVVENKLRLQEENPLTDALFNYGLTAVLVGEKWGFINMQGEMVIEPQFDSPGKFYQGLYAVNKDGKYWFINTKGETVTEPAPGAAMFFTENYCVVRKYDLDEEGNPVNFRSAFINADGKTCFETPEKTVCWPVRDGMSIARSNHNSIIVYTPQGETLFEIENSSVFNGDESTNKVFYEGLLCLEQNDKWGAVNTKGEWVIQPQYENLNYFENGIAKATVNGRYGYINKQGEWVIQPQFIEEYYYFSEGLSAARTDDKVGYIDAEGNWKIVLSGYEWVHLDEFVQGVTQVSTNKGYGLLGKDGNWICEPQYERIYRVNCGVAPVEVSSLSCGVINTSGEMIVQPLYRVVEKYYDDGYAVAQKQNGKWVILDTEGNVVLDGGFDGIGHHRTYYHEDGSLGSGTLGR